MSITFPRIKPSEREFTMGVFPIKTYRSLSGATVKRSFGNKPHSYQLRLVFNNIQDDIVGQILDHYNTAFSGFQRFALPSVIFAGMNTTLTSKIQSPYNIQWEYASPPTVQSVFNGISSVSVELTGEINV